MSYNYFNYTSPILHGFSSNYILVIFVFFFCFCKINFKYIFFFLFFCRFSPTRTPSPWDGIRISDKFSPVCPQRLPNIQNETAALEKMPKGRLEYLKRLLPFLQNQSEDCLYLNVFSPVHGELVFIFYFIYRVKKKKSNFGIFNNFKIEQFPKNIKKTKKTDFRFTLFPYYKSIGKKIYI